MFGKRARWALWAAASLNFSPLTRGQPLVVPNFIPPELTVALRADLLVLQAAGAFRPSGARDATRDAAAARRTRLAPRRDSAPRPRRFCGGAGLHRTPVTCAPAQPGRPRRTPRASQA
jgi:hypothetical protein